MKASIIFISLLLLLGVPPADATTSSPVQGYQRRAQFTRFTASFDWPETACKLMEYCEQKPERFILQSLSPNGNAIRGLHADTIYATLRKHLEDLMEYWPILATTDASISLNHWFHEYDLHGTACSETFDPEQYILKAIEVAKVFSMHIHLALKNRNIRPDAWKTYKPSKIGEAVRMQTKYCPRIVCEEIDGQYYLSKIEVCLDRTAKIHHCFCNVYCPGVERVIFPPLTGL